MPTTPSRPNRALSPMRAVRDRSDGYCVRVVNVPPTLTLQAIKEYVGQYEPVLQRKAAKDVFEARFATESDSAWFAREFDWRKLARDT